MLQLVPLVLVTRPLTVAKGVELTVVFESYQESLFLVSWLACLWVVSYFEKCFRPLLLGEDWGEGLTRRSFSYPLPQPFSQREKGDKRKPN